MKVVKLSEKLLGLSYMWFGTKEESARFTVQEELELYDVIENRILGYGRVYKETIPEALALAGLILKQEEKENRKARRKLLLKRVKELKDQLSDCFREYLSKKEM